MYLQFAALEHSDVLTQSSHESQSQIVQCLEKLQKNNPPPQIASFLTLKATLSIHPFSIHSIQLVLIRIAGVEAAATLHRPCHHVKP